MTLITRLTVTLAILWLLLSGMFKTQLLVFGVLSVALVVWLAVRMRVLQHQGQPVYFRFFGILAYWRWLAVEIIKSNIAVTRAILSRDLPIKPVIRRVKASPETEIGRVIYANSITLTPGTTAINFTPSGEILVHALHESSLHELEKGEMAERVRQVEPRAETQGQPR